MGLPRAVAITFHLGYVLACASWVRSWRHVTLCAGVLALLWAAGLFYLTVDRNRRP